MKAFIDFETTGLDPQTDRPLEFALVLTDDALVIRYERTFLFRWSAEQVEQFYADCHERVAEMHEKNGLWEDLLAGSETSIPIAAFEATLHAMLDHCATLGPLRSTEIAGFNPFFDRKWLEVLAPTAVARLHYRSYDVSTLRTTVWDVYRARDEPPVPHRSLGDCHSAIEYARRFRSDWLVPF